MHGDNYANVVWHDFVEAVECYLRAIEIYTDMVCCWRLFVPGIACCLGTDSYISTVAFKV